MTILCSGTLVEPVAIRNNMESSNFGPTEDYVKWKTLSLTHVEYPGKKELFTRE